MIKMQACGGVVAFTDFSPEAVEDVLAEVGAVSSRGSSTWGQAFGEFSLLLNPQTRGTYLVSSNGGNVPSPTELFSALNPYLVDGSWLAFKEVGSPAVKIFMIQGGFEGVKEVDAHDIFQGNAPDIKQAETFSRLVLETLSTLGYELLPIPEN